MKLAYLLIFAYLIGSLTFANIFSIIFFGEDLRKRGTGYTGASNLIAAYGFKWGILAGVFDIFKTLIVLVCARIFGMSDIQVMLSGITATLGHIFPVFFRFKGGKGGACAATTLVFMLPRESLIVIGIAIIAFALSRVPVIVFLVAFVSYPVVLLVSKRPLSMLILTVVLFLILLTKIGENVVSFFRGKELRVG